MKKLFEEIEMKTKEPIVLKINNQTAIKQLQNEAVAASAKNVNIKLYIWKTTPKRARCYQIMSRVRTWWQTC